MKLTEFLSGLLLAAMPVCTPVAADYQSHASITGVASEFMLEHVAALYQQRPEVVPDRLDSRLRLRKCDIPLQASLPPGSRDLGRVTVGVRCADSRPWSLHVPVRISVYKQVVVAARTLSRDTLLGAADVELAPHDLSELRRGYFEDTARSLGMKLKRRIAAGDPLTPAMLEKPRIIERGQRVNIVAGFSGMEVRTSGKALSHGAVGERIRVLNLSSQQKLEGVITASGEIRVDI